VRQICFSGGISESGEPKALLLPSWLPLRGCSFSICLDDARARSELVDEVSAQSFNQRAEGEKPGGEAIRLNVNQVPNRSTLCCSASHADPIEPSKDVCAA
jgi:hypothetical protein